MDQKMRPKEIMGSYSDTKNEIGHLQQRDDLASITLSEAVTQTEKDK